MSDSKSVTTLPGLLLGIGLGGLVDGVVLHQILQWHHMVSEVDRYPPDSLTGLRANTVADGLFHAATIVLLVVGLVLLQRQVARGAALPRGRRWWGAILAGWGVFNLVEGLVDHHILGVHHVRSGPDALMYDLAFLALGAVLALTGWAMIRRRPRETGTRETSPR